MFNKKERKIMFVGDDHLKGFKQHFIKHYPRHTFIESIREGEVAYDLRERLKKDVLSEKPDIVIISIGSYDAKENENSIYLGTYSSMYRYETLCHEILRSLEKAGIDRVILIEPFFVSTFKMFDSIRYDIQDKIYILRKVASDYDFKIVAADGILNQLAINEGRSKAVSMSGFKMNNQGRLHIMEECGAILESWGVR